MNPQLLLAAMQALKQKEGDDAAKAKELRTNLTSDLQTGASLIGGLIQGTSGMSGKPNVAQETFGGALSGFASGGVLGAGLGAFGGWMSGSSKLENYLTNLDMEQKANIISKTVQPTTYADGGNVDKVGIQTEINEYILLPTTLELLKSTAKVKHNKMKKNDITEFVEPGSYVFSNKNKLDPNKIKEDVLGQSLGYYSEEESFSPEKVMMGNLLGTSKLTFAEAAEKLKNKITTVGKTKDIFDKITDAENKNTRLLYLSKLIKSSEGSKTQNGVQFFERGGFVSPEDILNRMKSGAGLPITSSTTQSKSSSVGAEYYKDVLSKLEELRGKNEQDLLIGKQKLADMGKKMRGSIAASLGTSMLFRGLQNPITKPVLQDTTFIEDMYRPPSSSYIESQIGSLRGGVNSMAQLMLRSGVDPRDLPTLLAASQGRAFDSEAALRGNLIQSRSQARASKYGALKNIKEANKASVINAENISTTDRNRMLAGFGSDISTFLDRSRDLAFGQFTGERNLERGYNLNDLNLFQTQADIAGNIMMHEDAMKRVDRSWESLQLEKERFNRERAMRSGNYSIPTLPPINQIPTSNAFPSNIDIKPLIGK